MSNTRIFCIYNKKGEPTEYDIFTNKGKFFFKKNPLVNKALAKYLYATGIDKNSFDLHLDKHCFVVTIDKCNFNVLQHLEHTPLYNKKGLFKKYLDGKINVLRFWAILTIEVQKSMVLQKLS